MKWPALHDEPRRFIESSRGPVLPNNGRKSTPPKTNSIPESELPWYPVEPRATPGLLSRELLPVCYTESYSRSATPRATPGLLRRQPAVQDPNPVLLSRELLPVCYTESYSRSVTPRATPGQLQRELLPVCYTETALRLHGTGLMRRHSSKNRAEQCEPCREGRQGQVQTIVFRAGRKTAGV